MLKHTVIIAATLLALAGCQKEPASAPPASAPPASAPPASAQPDKAASDQIGAEASNPAISVVPDSLQNCDGAVVTVHWDASKLGVTTYSTEIWAGSSNADARLFAAGGSSGEASTDAWARPGTRFFLKDKSDGKELGQAVVGGPACQ